jgi:hypothetical protein
MRGAIPPLPNTASYYGAYLSTGTTLPFTFYTYFNKKGTTLQVLYEFVRELIN